MRCDMAMLGANQRENTQRTVLALRGVLVV